MVTDLTIVAALKREGYQGVRQLPNGEWVGVFPFLYTAGLCVGLTPWGYRTRYCYESRSEAHMVALIWDGTGDPPGNWVKRKGDREYLNPQWARSH